MIEQVIGSVVVIVVAIIAGLIRSYKNPDGMINKALSQNETAREAHESIPEIKDTLQGIARDVTETNKDVKEMDEKVEIVDERLDDVARTMAVIHKDDEDVPEEELRERLDVDELDDDLVRGSR